MLNWKCPNCWTEYEIDEKFKKALENKKDCKFCVRKDPKVPTTAEMDGLLTREDMRDRFKVVFQCRNCNKWTQHTYKPGIDIKYLPCANCHQIDYDITSIKSIRTYNPLTDNKRRPKKKK